MFSKVYSQQDIPNYYWPIELASLNAKVTANVPLPLDTPGVFSVPQWDQSKNVF